MSEDKKNKTRCTKKYRFSAIEVAEIAEVSESYVKKIRLGDYYNSEKARQVIQIDKVLDEGSNKLLKEIENVIKF